MKALVLAFLLLSATTAAQADTVRVFAAGAAKAAVQLLEPDFERDTGHRVQGSFDAVGALAKRLDGGEAADIVILSAPSLDGLLGAGRIRQAEAVDIGRTGVGLGVAAGQPVAPLKNLTDLRALLEAAPSIAQADPARGATAGTQFRAALEALGMSAALAPKLRVMPSGIDVMEAVARGEVALGVSQATEILDRKGVTFVGFLPDPLQRWVVYRVVLVNDTRAARAFFDTLTDPRGREAFRRIGFAE